MPKRTYDDKQLRKDIDPANALTIVAAFRKDTGTLVELATGTDSAFLCDMLNDWVAEYGSTVSYRILPPNSEGTE